MTLVQNPVAPVPTAPVPIAPVPTAQQQRVYNLANDTLRNMNALINKMECTVLHQKKTCMTYQKDMLLMFRSNFYEKAKALKITEEMMKHINNVVNTLSTKYWKTGFARFGLGLLYEPGFISGISNTPLSPAKLHQMLFGNDNVGNFVNNQNCRSDYKCGSRLKALVGGKTNRKRCKRGSRRNRLTKRYKKRT